MMFYPVEIAAESIDAVGINAAQIGEDECICNEDCAVSRNVVV